MNLEQARAVLADKNHSTLQGLEASAVVLRYYGISDPALLSVAESLESVVDDLKPKADGAPAP